MESTHVLFTPSQLAEVMNTAKTTILRRAERESWPYTNGGNRVHRFLLSDLPADIQSALVAVTTTHVDANLLPVLAPEAALAAATRIAETPLSLSLYNKDSAAWSSGITTDLVRDPRVGRIVRMIQEARTVPKGWGRRAWIQAVALKGGTTWQNLYRYMARYEKQGLAGLRHTKSNAEQPKAWSPEAVEWWVGLCLKKEHRKLARDGKKRLYAILIEEASRQGWRIGSYRSALWWIERKVTPQLRALQRGGARALDNTLPPVLRDYSDLAPFEILVGDQHRFDFWVQDEDTGEVFRPEGYFWLDLRTRCWYGGALDRKYDSYLMGLALRMGLKIYGPFGSIYTDHGKPEESRYIMGIMKEMRNLGLGVDRTTSAEIGTQHMDGDPDEINPLCLLAGTHRKAIVRNAKAKMIEGRFHKFEQILRADLLCPGYVKDLGGLQEENEVDQLELQRLAKAGKLLGFQEFFLRVLKGMDIQNNRAHRGVLKEWAWKPRPPITTPMDCLRMCCGEGWRPVRLSEEAIDLVFLPRAERKVVLGRIQLDNEVYEHEALIPIDAWVDVRFDPMDATWIHVFHEGRYLCTAYPVTYSSMKDRDLARQKIEDKRRRRKGFITEYRRLTSCVPDVLHYSETPAIERAAAQIGKAQSSRLKAESEVTRAREPGELADEIKRLEDYRPTVKRPLFRHTSDRYQWLIEHADQVTEEDRGFMGKFEGKMSAETRDYWAVYREGVQGPGSKVQGSKGTVVYD